MKTMSSCFSSGASTPTPAHEDPVLSGLIQDVENEFSTMVYKARIAIRRRAQSIHPELQPLGYKVLSVLVRQTAHQQIALAEELEVDKATMSRTIKQLQVQGLVTRTPDPADGRAMLVSITPSARASFVASGIGSRTLLRERLASWEPDEIKRFSDLLARLNVSSVMLPDHRVPPESQAR